MADKEAGRGDLALVERIGGSRQCYLGIAEQQPGNRYFSQRFEDGGGVQPSLVHLSRVVHKAHQMRNQDSDGRLGVVQHRAQDFPFGAKRVIAWPTFDERADLVRQGRQRRPLIAGDLAEEQVEPLNGSGSLVKRVDLCVPDVLLDREVLRVSGTPKHLE